MKRFALALVLVPAFLIAQGTAPATQQTSPPSLIDSLPARNVGPTTMGGRIVDVAIYEKEPRIFYIGTAGGGVWKTENGGLTTKPVFYREGSSNLGALAVSSTDPNIVYVATGEGTSRNSVGWGDGVYKTTDGGKTWANVGLKECRHFHRIIIDPKDPNVVYAAGLGDLWGYNSDRGLYKTTDGGKTWNKILYINEKTGISELIMNPKNPKELLVSSYEKIRSAYDWTSGGPGSAIFKSTDAGKTWKKITKGLPEKGNFGRIGMNYFYSNPKVVVALIEHNNAGDRAGTGFYRSEDGGESWKKMSNRNDRPFYFSIPRQDPIDENRVYAPAVSIAVSDNKGETFRNMASSVHVDHHSFWINPKDNNHIIMGEDGGVAQSRDRGATWEHINTMPIGQFYAVSFDMRKPYWIFGGLQDNGSWASPTQTDMGGVAFFHAFTYTGGDGFHTQNDPDDWGNAYSESQGGAIGRVNLRENSSVSIRPRPATTAGLVQGERIRYNWSTPFILSPHNSKTLYLGGNKLFKSVNRGDNWRVISPDLTTNDPTKLSPGKNSVTPENTGAEMHCTIITISESPKQQGILWVGTDDGLVHVSKDDGNTWDNVTGNISGLPKNTWVSRVTASRFEEGRAYATFDGHRSNDYNTYVYVTEDFGKTWTKLNGNLPANEPAYVIREGLKNPNLLLIGTEFSLYISLDRGTTWTRYRGNDFPTVRIDDLALHPRDGDLIIGTHGRSIYIMPISALEELTEENMKKDVHLCKPAPVYLLGRVNGKQWDGDGIYMSPNTQPGTTISYHLKAEVKEAVQVIVSDAEGRTISTIDGTKAQGLNTVTWNAGRLRRALTPGDYRVTLKVGDKEFISSVKVDEADR